MYPASGAQYGLSHGDYSLIAVEVGGGLRTFECGGQPILHAYDADMVATSAEGQPLIPWPNRLHQGSYEWDGHDYQVPIDEVGQGNALHGFSRWYAWHPRNGDQGGGDGHDDPGDARHLTLGLLLPPRDGYPFALDLTTDYRLDAGGLTVTTTAVNVGGRPAPYAHGAHPYVVVDADTVDDTTVTIPADTYLPTDDAQIPVGRRQVDGTAHDFREPRRMAGMELDHAFTDLRRDDAGRATVVVRGEHRGVEVWVDETYPYVMVFTGHDLPQQERRRRSLGIEPMTCPPNGFATGEDIVRLEPGESFMTTWGIRAQGANA
jgi:aldose 1-epimerase